MDLKSVLFIRRDNIGDLVCTTPAIRALRIKYPKAHIGVLVNSYNAGVLEGNPDVDEVFVYEKGKHSGKGLLSQGFDNISLLRRIRQRRFEVAIGCSYSYQKRLARYTFFTGAPKRIGFVPQGSGLPWLSYNCSVAESKVPIHEVEAMMALLEPLGVAGPPPPLFMRPDPVEVERVRRLMGIKETGQGRGPVVFHISSRRPKNRWPKESFKALGERIGAELGLKIMLLWSPGSTSNPLHPGDDEDAAWIATSMKPAPFAYRTTNLGELTAAMSLASLVVSLDGGAMHIAAALGKPVLTVWGSTEQKRWHPWGVPSVVLQGPDKLASSVTVEEAYSAFKGFFSRISKGAVNP